MKTLAERGQQFIQLAGQGVSLATWDWMAQDEVFNRAMYDYVAADSNSKEEGDAMVRIAQSLDAPAIVVAHVLALSVFDAEAYDVSLGRLRTAIIAQRN